MSHPLAGQKAPRSVLVDVPALVSAYYTVAPNLDDPRQKVAFGTSGHRGCAFDGRFNDAHIAAIAQAICEYRSGAGITGPLYLGKDTHALSTPAHATALEVFAANGITVCFSDGYVPTPAISHAILTHNLNADRVADGVVITPSHNPPRDGGFKYNPPHGGPAGGDVTKVIENRANALLAEGNAGVKRIALSKALAADTTRVFDFVSPYVNTLDEVLDMKAIAGAGLRIGVDPMGGSGIAYWGPIAERYGLNIEVVNDAVDPTFSFMTLDRDGKIRMDCSSPYAMASLVALKDRFDIAFGNDTDYDRHGIVCAGSGLMNPNHYLSVAVNYLFTHRKWPGAAIGKTLVSSSMIDRVAKDLGRELKEVPVGFKHFVTGLRDGSYGFGGEESAGASFLRKDGTVWSTDKDGILLDLLACEIIAKTGKDPAGLYADLEAKHGSPVYERTDAPATVEQKATLKKLSPEQVTATELAGEAIQAKLTVAPGNGEALGGLKVITENGWFAARPSGTEDIYKIYAESFKGEAHLREIQEQAQGIVDAAL